MKFQNFKDKYLAGFDELKYIYEEGKGGIVWRLGTGWNIELLHIRAFEEGKGHAKMLLGMMIKELEKDPPYHSVFGFALEERKHLLSIYPKLGFHIEVNDGPYKDSKAILFWQKFEKLKELYA